MQASIIKKHFYHQNILFKPFHKSYSIKGQQPIHCLATPPPKQDSLDEKKTPSIRNQIKSQCSYHNNNKFIFNNHTGSLNKWWTSHHRTPAAVATAESIPLLRPPLQRDDLQTAYSVSQPLPFTRRELPHPNPIIRRVVYIVHSVGPDLP